MEDMENVLMELSSLEKTPQVASIPACLDEYLASVASTGKAVFAWSKVKPLFRRKLELIIQEFSESCPTESLARQPNVDMFNFEQMKERIFEQLESYTGLPFTIQRLCELMVQPKKHYKRIDKYMRGLEKVMLVAEYKIAKRDAPIKARWLPADLASLPPDTTLTVKSGYLNVQRCSRKLCSCQALLNGSISVY